MEEQVKSADWNVFDRVQYRDESTTQYEFVEYKERNVQVTNLNEYNMINQDLDVPLMIPDSFLHVQCQIQNAATGAAIATGKVAFNNNGFNVFYRAQYYMNDQLIEDVEDVGVATLVNGLINYSRGYSDSMSNELWILDNNSGSTNSLTVYAADGTQLSIATSPAIAGNINNTLQLTKPATVGANLADGQELFFYLGNL